jgi:uncharacterized protein YbbC (DUF1343 family)
MCPALRVWCGGECGYFGACPAGRFTRARCEDTTRGITAASLERGKETRPSPEVIVAAGRYQLNITTRRLALKA